MKLTLIKPSGEINFNNEIGAFSLLEKSIKILKGVEIEIGLENGTEVWADNRLIKKVGQSYYERCLVNK